MRGLSTVWLVSAVACNLVLGIDERAPKPSPVEGAGGNGVVATKLYVSPAGDDANDGLSHASPKKTIAGALDAARIDAVIEDIDVCAGSYSESELVLDVPVSLRGGFDCANWEQSDGYGWDSFDGIHETVVEAVDEREAVLRTVGAAVDRSVLIDGFTWRAGESDRIMMVAVAVQDESSPTISNNRLIGGSGTRGSIGLVVEADPNIFHNEIFGGSATGSPEVAQAGSTGVQIDAGAQPFIHENRIAGGTGVWLLGGDAGMGSIGIRSTEAVISNSTKNPIERNEIRAGTGPSWRAIEIFGGVVSLVENIIVGSSEGCTTTTGCSTIVLANVGGGSQVRGNRIFGGGGHALVFALNVFTAPTIVIESNLIFGAKGDGSPAAGAYALQLSTSSPNVRHNTIYTGTNLAPGWDIGITLRVAITGASIDNNIVLTGATGSQLLTHVCPSGPLSNFRNNAMLDHARMTYGGTNSPCPTLTQFVGMSVIEDELKTKMVDAENNVVLRADCTEETSTSCVTVPPCTGTSLDACAAAVFASWTAGGDAEFLGDGWLLSPMASCTLRQSSLDLQVETDFLGNDRTAPPSMGGHEQNEPCQ